VLGWVLGRPMEEVHVLDALARFSHIPSSDIDACFAILQSRGVLVCSWLGWLGDGGQASFLL
jgi:hypothetical protein